MSDKIRIKNDAHWHDLRAKCIGASESAALFGASPYMSRYALYMFKKHGVKTPETEPMVIGRCVESGIADAAMALHKTQYTKSDYYYADWDFSLGATLDYIDRDGCPVEIKNVGHFAYQDYWQDGIPLHYKIQLQQQMGLTESNRATLIALVGGSQLEIFTEDFNPAFYESLKIKAKQFWLDIKADNEPDITSASDFNVITSTLIDRDADVVAMDENPVFCQIAEELKQVEAEKKTLSSVDKKSKLLKAKLMQLVGNHAGGKLSDGFKIKSTQIAEATIAATTRKAYTRVTVTLPKE